VYVCVCAHFILWLMAIRISIFNEVLFLPHFSHALWIKNHRQTW